MRFHSSVIKSNTRTLFATNLYPIRSIRCAVIMDSKKAKDQDVYKFSWEVVGYDCGPPEIRSPNFIVSFEVTEWYMKLDLSKLESIDSCIPFSLQRVPGTGPCDVSFDVKVTLTLSDDERFGLGHSWTEKTFNEKESLSHVFDIASRKVKPEDLKWLTSKDLFINLEMKSPPKHKLDFFGKYWESKTSVKAVVDALKTLSPTNKNPAHYDLVLKVDGKELKLHKFILNARWQKLMSTLEVDAPSDKVETKEFSDIPQAILEHLLNFAYYGDLDFMFELDKIVGGPEVFDLVNKYNFYRLNDQITQLSPKCSSTHFLQSYRTSFEMQLTNVTSTETAIGDFRTCEIPLKPTQLPKSNEPMDSRQIEKFQQHIRFMDIRLYVEKGPLGYNWLNFSIVLGKLPEKNPVIIKCKLYVVDESDVKHLLTEENLVFDREKAEVICVETPFSKGKSERFRRICKSVITWEELIDERKCFMRKRPVTKPSIFSQRILKEMKSPVKQSRTSEPITTAVPECWDGDEIEPLEKDLYFRLELKLSDGEYVYDIRHGPCEFKYEDYYKIFEDLASMREDKFTDIEVTAGFKRVKAHKAILAARSLKIKRALEKKQNLKSLSINIHPDYLQMFIDYFYTGKMKEVPFDEIDNLISVASDYEMKCLADLLSEEKTKLKMADYSKSEKGSFESGIFHAEIAR